MTDNTSKEALQILGISTEEVDKLVTPQATEQTEVETQTNPITNEEQTETQTEAPAEQLPDNPLIHSVPASKSFESLDDAAKYLGELTGYPIEKPEDLVKIGEQYKTLNETLGTIEDENKKLKDYEDVFLKLPSEIYDIVTAHMDGKDYKQKIKEIGTTTIDFSKPVDKIGTKELLNHYFPGKYTEDDIAEMNEDAALTKVVEHTKDLYELDKKKFEFKQEQEKQTYQAAEQKYRESYAQTIKHLTTVAPQMSSEQKKKIEGVLSGGQTGILKIFLNDDGTFKPNASELLVWAQYGKEAYEYAVKKGSQKGEQEALKHVVTRGADNIPTKGSGQAIDDTAVKQYLDNIGLGGAKEFKY